MWAHVPCSTIRGYNSVWEQFERVASYWFLMLNKTIYNGTQCLETKLLDARVLSVFHTFPSYYLRHDSVHGVAGTGGGQQSEITGNHEGRERKGSSSL